MDTGKEIYFYNQNKDFGFLSNFYMSNFTDPKTDITYCCSEQYFMHQKCLTFDPTNKSLIKKILDSDSPSAIKKYGRNIKNYDDEIWSEKRFKIMKKGLLLKFNKQSLKNKLLSTGDKKLYEASPYDKIWGTGVSVENSQHADKEKFGQNLLGKCLMKVRANLSEF